MAMKNVRLALMGLAMTGAVACGDDAKDGGEPITSVSARQALTANTQNVSAKLSAAINFLEQSELANRGFSMVAPQGDCVAVDGSGADFDGGECAPSEPVEIDTDLSAPTDELTDYLETRIFADANIESSSDTSITYLLKGSVVCAPSDPIEMIDQGCVDSVDASEIRLKVTSPSEGDVDVALLVGPAKHNPLSIEVHSSMVAAELDLAGVKGAVLHLAGDEGVEDLPSTMEGRLRAEIEVLGAEKVRAAVSVLSKINVAGGDYALSLGATSPAAEIVADGAAQTISASANLGAFNLMMPYSTEVYGDDGSFTEITHVLDVALAGLSSSVAFQGGSDTVSFTNMGLGDATSTIKVDGSQVLGIDLNADAGRAFAATIEALENGGTIKVSPKFDLKVAMDFSVLADDPDADFPTWAMGDVLQVTLDGTDPTLEFSDAYEGMKLISGAMSMSLQNAGDSISVAAGQCLSGTVDEPSEPFDPTMPVEPVEPVEPTQEGPFDSMVVGECAL